ncbi:LysM peptidoglycan-binding domain-containing protein [Coralloluteibacterium thermophilus]|uniref:LysM peptidoglycan-binding domain-containing protein n=1 Tax=Coralloluteibacterium thermophilum TaxID=2707049 RepID=A0ABV9NLG6_9GAMM
MPDPDKPEQIPDKSDVLSSDNLKDQGSAYTGVGYTVVEGDTLEGIARAHYGDPDAAQHILTANREVIGDPRALKPGTVLTLPHRG